MYSKNESGIGFTCKHCQVSFKSITDLTVHMNSTGHYNQNSGIHKNVKPNVANIKMNGIPSNLQTNLQSNLQSNLATNLQTNLQAMNNPLNQIQLQNTLKNFFGLAAMRNKLAGITTGYPGMNPRHWRGRREGYKVHYQC